MIRARLARLKVVSVGRQAMQFYQRAHSGNEPARGFLSAANKNGNL